MWEWKSPKKTGRVFEWGSSVANGYDVFHVPAPLMTKEERYSAKVRQHNECEAALGKNDNIIPCSRRTRQTLPLDMKVKNYEAGMPARITDWEKALEEEKKQVAIDYLVRMQNVVRAQIKRIEELTAELKQKQDMVDYQVGIIDELQRRLYPIQQMPSYSSYPGGLLGQTSAGYPGAGIWSSHASLNKG